MNIYLNDHKIDEMAHVSFSRTGNLDPVIIIGNYSSHDRSTIYSRFQNYKLGLSTVNNNNIQCLSKGSTNNQLNIYLLFSHGCPLGCLYCLSSEEGYNKSKCSNMSTETALQSIKSVLPFLAKDGTLQIIFFGGEPLYNHKLFINTVVAIDNMIHDLRPDIVISWNLTSSLSILPDNIIDILYKYRFHILCDVDGPLEIHNKLRPFKDGSGSFNTIKENIFKLQDRYIPISGRATVTSLNANILEEVLKIHKQLGFIESALVPVNPFSSGGFRIPTELLPNIKTLYNSLCDAFNSNIYPVSRLFPLNLLLMQLASNNIKHSPCGAPDNNLYIISSDGKLWPCIYFVGEPAVSKNLSTSEELKSKFTEKMISKCNDCSLLPICSGGCLATYAYTDPLENEYGNQLACVIINATIDTIMRNRIEEIKGCIDISNNNIIYDAFIPTQSSTNITDCILCGCEGCTACTSCTYCTGCTRCTQCTSPYISSYIKENVEVDISWDNKLIKSEKITA